MKTSGPVWKLKVVDVILCCKYRVNRSDWQRRYNNSTISLTWMKIYFDFSLQCPVLFSVSSLVVLLQTGICLMPRVTLDYGGMAEVKMSCHLKKYKWYAYPVSDYPFYCLFCCIHMWLKNNKKITDSAKLTLPFYAE